MSQRAAPAGRKLSFRRAFVVALPLQPLLDMITAGGKGFGGSVVAGVVLAALLVTGCMALDRDAAVARGGQVFRDQGCYGCHTVEATGTPIATDLTRIGAKHDAAYFVRWLRDPSQQKPRQHMPKIALSDGEVRALAAYLSSLH